MKFKAYENASFCQANLVAGLKTYMELLIRTTGNKNMNDRERILTNDLFNISEVVLSTDNTEQRDRWGAVLGMEVLGLRINDCSIIFSHIAVDDSDEGDSMRELEEVTVIENLFDRTKYIHDCYYEGLDVYYQIEDPRDLKNRSAKVCKLLDQYYSPIKEFIPTPPSVILPIITKNNTYESGREWAWFNKTLYLTQSIKKRGLYNSHDEFDNSLFNILSWLKFEVKKVNLIGYDNELSLIENIKKTIHFQQLRDIEQLIHSKSSELELLMNKAGDLEQSIAALNIELGILRSGKSIQQK